MEIDDICFTDINFIYSNKISKLLTIFFILIITQKFSGIKDDYYNKLSTLKNESYQNLLSIMKEKSDIINLFQLYIENRTKFYLKGREKIMENSLYKYNDSNIITIQDKLNWLLIHDTPEIKSRFVDKILLHNFSIEILGKDICVPIIKIYNNVDDIDLKELPNQFVLKCNHGSLMNILCNNKTNFNLTQSKKLLEEWVNINYGLKNLEFQYININRKIFAEKYLGDDILDYKFYCFNGNPKFIRVQKHMKNQIINNYYNLDWKLTEIETNIQNYIRRPDIEFKKPKNLRLMIEYAKKFAKRFIFVRVDLYENNNKVYLGELTFSPSNIKMPLKDRNQSIYIGNFLDIDKTKKE
jgi:hypothetical protein